jgi:hypothetical protein
MSGAASAVPYSDIPYIPRRWHWRGYVPVATPVVYAAAGGTGKGMLFAAVAARLVLGLPFPGEDQTARRDPRAVVWITGPGEDDIFEDLAPRLRAAIASAAAQFELDPDDAAAAIALVYDLSQYGKDIPLTLPADVGILAGEIDAINASGGPPVGLVVADSLSALLSEDYTINSRQGARRVMGALARFARRADVALALLHHVTSDGKVAGSPAVLDAVRLAFKIEFDPDKPELRTIIRHKSNASVASPQQYVITGDEPATHAVFIDGGDTRAARVRQEAGRAATATEPAATDPPAEPADPGSFTSRLAAAKASRGTTWRVLRRDQTYAGRDMASDTVADGLADADAGKAAAEAHAGRDLRWADGPAGMQVAAFDAGGGRRVSYGVRPVVAGNGS